MLEKDYQWKADLHQFLENEMQLEARIRLGKAEEESLKCWKKGTWLGSVSSPSWESEMEHHWVSPTGELGLRLAV